MILSIRNNIVRFLSGLPVYTSVAALCLLALVETRSEMSQQSLYFLYTVLAVMACAVITWILNNGKVRPGIVDLTAVLFFGWYLLCYKINGSIVVSKLLETCLLFILYISLRIIFVSYRNIRRWILFVLFICGVIQAVIGVRQGLGFDNSNHNLFAVTGTFFNPGPYGGYISVILAIAIGYVVSRYRDFEKIFECFKRFKTVPLRKILWTILFITALCSIVTIAIIITSTMSRAAFVAVGLTIIAIIFNDARIHAPIVGYIKKHPPKAIAIGLTVLILVSGAGYGIYTLKKDSADGRLLMWKTGARVMLEHPLTGVGPGYFRGAFGDVQARYFKTGEGSPTEIKVAGCPEYGFNEYLQIGAGTGLTGLILFLCLVITALRRLFRSGSSFAFGLVALLGFAFFSYPFSVLPINMLLVIFISAAGSFPTAKSSKGVMGSLIAGFMVVCIAPAGILSAKPYLARINAVEKWQEARRWYSMEYYSYVLEDYPELFPMLKENPTFLFEYGRTLYIEKRYGESLEIMIPATTLTCDPMYHNIIGNNYKELQDYGKAAEAYIKAYHIIPHRMYPLFLLGKMYWEKGDEAQAVTYARRVTGMVPKIESPATRDMQQQMKEILEKINSDEK